MTSAISLAQVLGTGIVLSDFYEHNIYCQDSDSEMNISITINKKKLTEQDKINRDFLIQYKCNSASLPMSMARNISLQSLIRQKLLSVIPSNRLFDIYKLRRILDLDIMTSSEFKIFLNHSKLHLPNRIISISNSKYTNNIIATDYFSTIYGWEYLKNRLELSIQFQTIPDLRAYIFNKENENIDHKLLIQYYAQRQQRQPQQSYDSHQQGAIILLSTTFRIWETFIYGNHPNWYSFKEKVIFIGDMIISSMSPSIREYSFSIMQSNTFFQNSDSFICMYPLQHNQNNIENLQEKKQIIKYLNNSIFLIQDYHNRPIFKYNNYNNNNNYNMMKRNYEKSLENFFPIHFTSLQFQTRVSFEDLTSAEKNMLIISICSSSSALILRKNCPYSTWIYKSTKIGRSNTSVVAMSWG